MSDGIRINNVQYSWGSLVLRLNDEPFYGFRSIGFGDKRTRVKTYGMGRHQAPRGRTRGKYEVDPVKLGGPVGSVQALREFIAEQAGTSSYGNTEFDATLQYIENEGSDSEKPITVEFFRLVWEGQSVAHEEGPDDMREEITLDCMKILRNGLALFDSDSDTP